jgi:hypothetical protein
MVNSGLNDYVRTQLQRGYTPDAIRAALLQAGYNPQDIDFALRVSRPAGKKFVLSGRTMIFALAGILAIVLLVFSGILLFGKGAKDIQVSMSIDQTELLPGDTLSITSSFSSEQKRVVPVSLEYAVSEKFTRKAVTSRSGRIDVGISAIDTKDIPLPANIAQGTYDVKLVAKYESLSRVQSASFTVQQLPEEAPVVEEPVTEEPELTPLEEPPSEVPCPESCDDLNPATDDTCVRGSCEHVIKQNYCGNGECEQGEGAVLCPEDCGAAQDKSAVITQALKQAKSNTEKAATLCNSLVLPQDADPCFAAIANETKKSALCSNIKDSRARDNCLWEFINTGDYSVCEQLSNRYLMTSCQSLARFSTIEQEKQEWEQAAQQAEQETEPA